MEVRKGIDLKLLARIGGLCAVAAALLTILNAFVLAPGGPGDPNLSAAALVKGAAGLHNVNQVGAFLDAFGVGLLLIFVIAVGRLGEPEGGVLSSAAAFMTATFFAIDVVWAGAEFAFADATIYNTDPNAAKALFLFSQSVLVVIAIPIALQYAAIGLLIVRSRVLPAVMGWIALAVAVVALVSVPTAVFWGINPVTLAAFVLATILWPAASGIMLFVRRPEAASLPAPQGRPA